MGGSCRLCGHLAPDLRGEFNTSGGHAYVIFGNGAGFGAAVDVSALNGNNGFAITGVDDAQGFQAVAKASDVNSDGFGQNDVLIGGDTTPAIFASIGAITIKGTATGSTAGGDFFGITAQHLAKLVVGTKTTTFHNAAVDDVLIDPANNDFRAVDFA